jgi:Site-specific recombinase XerD
MKSTDLSRHLTGYLSNYLPAQRNLSSNTIKSYSDVFRLLLLYCRNERKMSIDRLCLKQLDRGLIENFLQWLADERGNSVSTINQRLAVVHAFFEYVRMEEPQLMLHCQKIMEIRFRRAPKPTVAYLSADALKVMLLSPDASAAHGRRDLTLLAVLYDTGARVQELVDLTVRNVRLEVPASITLKGKGQKTRTVPIMRQTTDLLKKYFSERKIEPVADCDRPLFHSKQHKKLTRAGVSHIVRKYATMARTEYHDIPEKVTPHVMRHTKAMHLVQADVNLIYIRDFLGHVDVHTTEVYAKAEPEVKRKALEKASELIQFPAQESWVEDADLMDWLKTFSKIS